MAQTPFEAGRWAGEVDTKLDTVIASQKRIEERFDKLPCVKHGKSLSRLMLMVGMLWLLAVSAVVAIIEGFFGRRF